MTEILQVQPTPEGSPNHLDGAIIGKRIVALGMEPEHYNELTRHIRASQTVPCDDLNQQRQPDQQYFAAALCTYNKVSARPDADNLTEEAFGELQRHIEANKALRATIDNWVKNFHGLGAAATYFQVSPSADRKAKRIEAVSKVKQEHADNLILLRRLAALHPRDLHLFLGNISHNPRVVSGVAQMKGIPQSIPDLMKPIYFDKAHIIRKS